MPDQNRDWRAPLWRETEEEQPPRPSAPRFAAWRAFGWCAVIVLSAAFYAVAFFAFQGALS
jgi:hypothetical protein